MNLSESLKYDCVLDLQVYDDNILMKTITATNTLMTSGLSGIYENLVSKDGIDAKTYGPISYCLFGTSTVATALDNTYDSFGASDGNYRYANRINSYNLGNKIKINISLEEFEFNIPAQLNPKLPIACVGLGFYSYTMFQNYIVPNYVFNRVIIDEGDRFFKTYSIKIGGSWTITISQ